MTPTTPIPTPQETPNASSLSTQAAAAEAVAAAKSAAVELDDGVERWLQRLATLQAQSSTPKSANIPVYYSYIEVDDDPYGSGYLKGDIDASSGRLEIAGMANDAHDGVEKCGVGLFLLPDSEGAVRVMGLAPGSPAERCGRIQKRDILAEVDGVVVYKQPLESFGERISGPMYSHVASEIGNVAGFKQHSRTTDCRSSQL